MKRFVLYLISFLFIVTLTFSIVEFSVRTLPNSYNLKETWMQANAQRLKTLILGSSHAYADINPSLIDSAFNLANSSQRLEYDYYLLKRYEDKYQNLKNIILVVDEYGVNLPEYENGATDWNRAIYYHIYMGYKKSPVFSKYSLELGSNTFLLMKLKALAKYKLTGSIDIGCDSLGFGSYYNIDDKNPDEMQSTYSKMLWADIDTASFHYNLSYLREIVKYCALNNFNLILVNPPFDTSFRKETPNGIKERFDLEIEKLQVDYPCIHYLDYSNNSGFKDSDFFNANHLSNIGSTKFTRMLMDTLKLN